MDLFFLKEIVEESCVNLKDVNVSFMIKETCFDLFQYKVFRDTLNYYVSWSHRFSYRSVTRS